MMNQKDEKDEISKYLANQILEKGLQIPDNSLQFSKEELDFLLFINKGEYKAISELYNNNDIFRKLDLSNIDWTNVDIHDIDFTGCNVIINPQKVRLKDMCSGKYPLDFSGMSFDGVKVDGSDFSGSIMGLELTKDKIDTNIQHVLSLTKRKWKNKFKNN